MESPFLFAGAAFFSLVAGWMIFIFVSNSSPPDPRPLFPFSLLPFLDSFQRVLFPFSDGLIAAFMLLIGVGLKGYFVPSMTREEYERYLEYQKYDYDGTGDEIPMDNFDWSRVFGFSIAMIAILVDWVLEMFVSVRNAGMLSFFLLPALVVWIDSYSSMDIDDSVRDTFAFLLGFFQTLIFFSGIANGWAFPYMLIAIYLIRGFDVKFSDVSRLFKLIFLKIAKSLRRKKQDPPLRPRMV
jgi:hypothetical protein